MIKLRSTKLSLDLWDNEFVKWTHEGKDYLLHASYDDWADSPREAYDNIDRMMCWHRRYNLGDKHDYGSPEEFWQRMVREHVSQEEVFDAVESGKLYGIRVEQCPTEPGYYDVYETCYLAGWQTAREAKEYLEYSEVPMSFLLDYIEDDLTIGHCQTLLEPYMEWLPLWLYDHSGITMSCGTRSGQYADRWDSGQVGWIVILKETVLKETGATEEDWREKAIQEMEASVEVYNQYIMGYCFDYTLYERDEDGEWQESDRTGGYYGTDILKNGGDDNGPGLREAVEAGEYEKGEAKVRHASWVEFD